MKSLLLVVGVFFLASTVTCCKRSNVVDKMEKEWPSLVGKNAEEAKKQILKARPDVEIIILPEDSMMTMDYRTDRVRIFIDDNKIVVRPPKVG